MTAGLVNVSRAVDAVMKSFASCFLRLLGFLAAAIGPSLWIGNAGAQNPAAVPTTVQLPTFHYFYSTGTIVVPDGGDALLGGISSSASGRVERGIPGLPSRPFTNSATGTTTGAGNVSVSAQIHDLEAMDQALLSQTAQGTGFHPPMATPQQLAAAKQAGEQLHSVAAIRAQQAAEDAAHEREAAAALARGLQLQNEGKLTVAKIYFQMAVRQSSANGDVHKQAVAALASMQQTKAAGKVAGQ
jgi:hypothetical protein